MLHTDSDLLYIIYMHYSVSSSLNILRFVLWKYLEAKGTVEVDREVTGLHLLVTISRRAGEVNVRWCCVEDTWGVA